MTFHLECKNLLNDLQFGFRRGKLTEEALRNMDVFVKDAKDKKLNVCIVTLDISNAFNSVRWTDIKTLLTIYEVLDDIKNLIVDFLYDRNYFDCENHEQSYNIGIPQSSTLGPILWLIVVNEVLKKQYPDGVVVQAFADDIVIMVNRKRVYRFESVMVEILNIIEDWCNLYQLKLNTKKSLYTIITAKGSYQESLLLSMKEIQSLIRKA